MKRENLRLLRDGAASLGVDLPSEALRMFEAYLDELLRWNARINLTAITDERDVIIKHFLDSLVFAKGMDTSGPVRLLDIGAGAGFPGIPLKLAFPHLDVVLLDSVAKKVSFMSHVCRTLRLSRIRAVHSRAEDLSRQAGYCGAFDLVMLRAVAEVSVATSLALPFLKADARPGGRIVLSRGAEEMKGAVALPSSVIEVSRHEVVLPGTDIPRIVLGLEKR